MLLNKLKKISDILQCYIFVYKELKEISRIFLCLLAFSTLAMGFLPILSQHVFKLVISDLEYGITAEDSLNIFNCIYLSTIYVFIMLSRSTVLNTREYISSLVSLKLSYNIKSKLINKIKKLSIKK